MVTTTYLEDLSKESELDFEIVSYEENLDDWIVELVSTNPEKAMSWGYEAFDNKLLYILIPLIYLTSMDLNNQKDYFHQVHNFLSLIFLHR
jgi:hypothetical protein